MHGLSVGESSARRTTIYLDTHTSPVAKRTGNAAKLRNSAKSWLSRETSVILCGLED